MWKLLCLMFLLAPGVELRPQTHEDTKLEPANLGHPAPKAPVHQVVPAVEVSKEQDSEEDHHAVLSKPQVHRETVLLDIRDEPNLHEKRNAPEHDAPDTTLKPGHDDDSEESSEDSKEHGDEEEKSRHRRDEAQPQANPAEEGAGDYPEADYDDYYEGEGDEGRDDSQQQPQQAGNFVPAVGNRRRRNSEQHEAHEEPEDDSKEDGHTTLPPKPHSKRQADETDYPAYGVQADYYDDQPVVPNANIPDFTRLEDVSPLDLTKRSDDGAVEHPKSSLPETDFQRKVHSGPDEHPAKQPAKQPEADKEEEVETPEEKDEKSKRETHEKADEHAVKPEDHADEHHEDKADADKEADHHDDSKEKTNVHHDEAARQRRDVLKAGSSEETPADNAGVHAKPAIETLVAVPVARPEDNPPQTHEAQPEESKNVKRETGHGDEHKENEKQHDQKEHEQQETDKDAHKEDNSKEHVEMEHHDEDSAMKEKREAEHEDDHKEAEKEHDQKEHEQDKDGHKEDKSKEHEEKEHASIEGAHHSRHIREDHHETAHSAEEDEKEDDSLEKEHNTTLSPHHDAHDIADHHRAKRADIYARRRPYTLKRGQVMESAPVRRRKSSGDEGIHVKPGSAQPVIRPNVPKPDHRQKRQATANRPATLPATPADSKRPAPAPGPAGAQPPARAPAPAPAGARPPAPRPTGAQPPSPSPTPTARPTGVIPRPSGSTQRPASASSTTRRPGSPVRPSPPVNNRPANARPGNRPPVPPRRNRPATPAATPSQTPKPVPGQAAKPASQPAPAAKPASQPAPAAKPASQPAPGARPPPAFSPVRTKRQADHVQVSGQQEGAQKPVDKDHDKESEGHHEEGHKDKHQDKETEDHQADEHHDRKTRNEPLDKQQLEIKPAPGPVLIQEPVHHVNDQSAPHPPVVQPVLDKGLKPQPSPAAENKSERKDVQADAPKEPKPHAAGHWTYGDDEAFDEWNHMFPVCSGPRQSPINIKTSSVSFTTFTPWKFEGYDQIPSKSIIKNNGHTAQMEVTLATVPTVCGGGLPNCYKFAQLHFHWGAKSVQGSEHTINDRRFPMEIHLVHYNEKYPNVSAAVASGAGDALAVLGFLYEISASDNPALNPLTDTLKLADSASSVVTITQPQSLRSLLARNLVPFFRYEGSLTTPPCSEIVIWTVFEEKIRISEKQLEAFRHIKTEEGVEMVDNYRPVQNEADAHGHLPPHAGEHRVVYYNNARDAYTIENAPETEKSAKNIQADKLEPQKSSGNSEKAATLAAFLPAALLFAHRRG